MEPRVGAILARQSKRRMMDGELIFLRHCERSEAIQIGCAARTGWIASARTRLAMTGMVLRPFSSPSPLG
jgi:hypothetical protein